MTASIILAFGLALFIIAIVQHNRREFRRKMEKYSADDIYIGLIKAEVALAEEKYPSWKPDPVWGSAVVSEESGELARAALQFEEGKGTREEMIAEAIQTAAVAIRFIKNYA